MPVRIKITLLFTTIIFLLLSLLCSAIYFLSAESRVRNIKTRLTNRAITTASLLSQSETFDPQLVQKIDASTPMALKNKGIQAYNQQDENIYSFNDDLSDTFTVNKELLDEVRMKTDLYFTMAHREAIAYNYTYNNNNIVVVIAGYDEEGKEFLNRLKYILFFSFLGGIIVAFASGYFFSKLLLRPVQKIADEVNIISARNLTHRIQTDNAQDEWSYLTTTLNDLLNRLQESFEIQRRFISNASHELLTPLTSVSSQLEVSLLRERAPEAYRNTIRSVYQDVRNMSNLTQTLLEFAKASGTPGGIEIDLVRIDEILMRLPAEIMKQNELYTVKLTFERLPEDEENLIVFGNEALLFTAVKNIVSNACKYSDNHLAMVNLTVMADEVRIVVTDEGKGISEQDLQNIFQPFYRTDDSRNIAGFGLGLSLAHRIVKLHKGNISVSSVPGKGTIFTIVIPIAGKPMPS